METPIHRRAGPRWGAGTCLILAMVMGACATRGAEQTTARSMEALAALRAHRSSGVGCVPAGIAGRYRPEIEPYVAHLKTVSGQRPVDYVLGLFRTHDIVVLCERDHRDISQYEFFYELIGDPRFLDQVGHIFTEIGSRTMNPSLDALLRTDGLGPEEVADRLMEIYRDFSWQGYWEKYNFYDFLERLYGLNAGLDARTKLTLHFTDLPVAWEGMTEDRYETEVRSLAVGRDRLMADFILKAIDDLDGQAADRRKYLVIMNYRHAFKAFPGGDNVADYIYRKYPDRIANVILSSLILLPESDDKSDTRAPVQGGKWDAAFQVLGNPEVGFDFAGTPFGADHFDYFDFVEHQMLARPPRRGTTAVWRRPVVSCRPGGHHAAPACRALARSPAR